jgi:hypothetical protein
MAPYLAPVRNYWALLPAIAVCVVLILLYAVPTLINPRWTSSVLGLFRQDNGTAEEADEAADLGEKQIRSRRLLASGLVLCALALVGFNVSLNREAIGCYQVAKAWGAVDNAKDDADPCISKLYGNFIPPTGESVSSTEKTQQPVIGYQVVEGKHPKYLNWIQNKPKYEKTDLLVGVGGNCVIDLEYEEIPDGNITVVINNTEPCPADGSIALTSIKLKKPLGDRKVITADNLELQRINPDMDSWPTVLKKLATGG